MSGWVRTGGSLVGKRRSSLSLSLSLFFLEGREGGRWETGTRLDTVASACFFSLDRQEKRWTRGTVRLIPQDSSRPPPPQKDNLAQFGMRATPSDHILLGRRWCWWWMDGEVQLRMQTRSPPGSQTNPPDSRRVLREEVSIWATGCEHLPGTQVTTIRRCRLLLRTPTGGRSEGMYEQAQIKPSLICSESEIAQSRDISVCKPLEFPPHAVPGDGTDDSVSEAGSLRAR